SARHSARWRPSVWCWVAPPHAANGGPASFMPDASQSINLTRASVAAAAASVEFIDLSEQATKAQIVRQGFDVPAVLLDQRRVDQVVGDLTQIPQQELPRVVSQSITSGTRVPAGTVVDLVLAPRNRIPFSVFDNVHLDLATRNLDSIDPLIADPAARRT